MTTIILMIVIMIIMMMIIIVVVIREIEIDQREREMMTMMTIRRHNYFLLFPLRRIRGEVVRV